MGTRLTVFINNKRYDVEIYEKEKHVYVARIGGKEYVIRVPKEWYSNMTKNEGIDRLKSLFEESAPRQPLTHLEHDGTVIRSDIPGRLVKFLVKEGEGIDQGQPVAVIESMKMMIEIRSPFKGRVKKVLVKERSFIDGGQPLVVIDQNI